MKDTVSKRTYVNREALVRIPAQSHPIGSVRLCTLTGEQLRGFYREKLQNLSPSSVGQLHNAINTACREQVRARTIRSNPAADVKLPRNQQSSRDKDVLTPQQVKALLDAIHGSRYETVIVLGATCALRVGEALALRWEDVDLKGGTVSIRHTLWKGTLYPPKTPQSRRTLKLPERALECLLRHRSASEGFLLETRSGNPVAPENFWKCGWKPALRTAGLDESLTFHQLRHGTATLLLNQNIPVPIVSRYLGHANPGITMKVYAHLIDGTSSMAAQGIDEALH
jgi:integrase